MRDVATDTACDICGRFVDRRDIGTATVIRPDGVTFTRDACPRHATTTAPRSQGRDRTKETHR